MWLLFCDIDHLKPVHAVPLYISNYHTHYIISHRNYAFTANICRFCYLSLSTVTSTLTVFEWSSTYFFTSLKVLAIIPKKLFKWHKNHLNLKSWWKSLQYSLAHRFLLIISYYFFKYEILLVSLNCFEIFGKEFSLCSLSGSYTTVYCIFCVLMADTVIPRHKTMGWEDGNCDKLWLCCTLQWCRMCVCVCVYAFCMCWPRDVKMCKLHKGFMSLDIFWSVPWFLCPCSAFYSAKCFSFYPLLCLNV